MAAHLRVDARHNGAAQATWPTPSRQRMAMIQIGSGAHSRLRTLLKSGLRQGDAGIAYEHGANIEVIICTLFDSAPRKPSTNDFEKTFKEHPYFAAEQSLRPFANSRERTRLTNAMSRSSKATMPFSKPSWRPRTPSSHPKIRRSPRFLNAITRPTRSFRVSSACCCCPRPNAGDVSRPPGEQGRG